jgi:agmatine deiminase
MVAALTAPGDDGRPGDVVNVLVQGDEALAEARRMLPGEARILQSCFGDIWLRDTGPIFVNARRCAVFSFNGWGGKYIYSGDEDLAERIAALSGAGIVRYAPVLEGGALDWDGEGAALTTRECLLNPNRNPSLSQTDIEDLLRDALGVSRLIWLPQGLVNDHTDGHVDNIARFIAPGVVACQSPSGTDDPNADRLEAIAAALAAETDAMGRRLHVVRIPSPGYQADEAGAVIPASHMNFIIGETSVVVPIYEAEYSKAALDALRPWFPGRRVVGLPARNVLAGGGAFHCITQQQPR